MVKSVQNTHIRKFEVTRFIDDDPNPKRAQEKLKMSFSLATNNILRSNFNWITQDANFQIHSTQKRKDSPASIINRIENYLCLQNNLNTAAGLPPAKIESILIEDHASAGAQLINGVSLDYTFYKDLGQFLDENSAIILGGCNVAHGYRGLLYLRDISEFLKCTYPDKNIEIIAAIGIQNASTSGLEGKYVRYRQDGSYHISKDVHNILRPNKILSNAVTAFVTERDIRNGIDMFNYTTEGLNQNFLKGSEFTAENLSSIFAPIRFKVLENLSLYLNNQKITPEHEQQYLELLRSFDIDDDLSFSSLDAYQMAARTTFPSENPNKRRLDSNYFYMHKENRTLSFSQETQNEILDIILNR
jgi:hypothetical protein